MHVHTTQLSQEVWTLHNRVRDVVLKLPLVSYEPHHEKTCLWGLQQAANNKGADQTAQMRRLICTFVVRIWHKQVFSWRGPYICSWTVKALSRLSTCAGSPEPLLVIYAKIIFYAWTLKFHILCVWTVKALVACDMYLFHIDCLKYVTKTCARYDNMWLSAVDFFFTFCQTQWNRKGGYLIIIEGYFLSVLYKNIHCGYSLESPRRVSSNEYPQDMILWRNKQNYSLITKYPPYQLHRNLVAVKCTGTGPGKQCWPRSDCSSKGAVWSGSTLFVILSFWTHYSMG